MLFKVGSTIYRVGRNARENWNLIENAEDGDIWIHLHNQPSCHVIIESKQVVTEEEILYGANLCKEYSKMKGKTTQLSVMNASFVKKGKCVGEARLLRSPKIVKL